VIDILYRDERLLVIDKPSGMLVHPSPWCRGELSCLQVLHAQVGQLVFPVHRLDRATSGVLVFALDAEMAGELCTLFRGRKVSKRYLAVVRGYTDALGVFSDPLKRRDRRGEREAVTEYTREAVVELHAPVGPYATARYSLVRAIPRTGRNHQIRRHFAHASHPVVGDMKHGDRAHNQFFRDAFDIERLLLFATDISFLHPATHRFMHFTAPLPANIRVLFSHIGWHVPSASSVRRPPCLPAAQAEAHIT